jgi:hypothetical protein
MSALLGDVMKFVLLLLSIVLVACAAASSAYSETQVLQQVPPGISVHDTQIPPDSASQQGPPAAPSLDQLTLQANFQLKLTLIVTIFGIIGLIFVAVIFRSSVATDTEKIVRLVIVVIVVCASLILISGGYSTDQIAPAFGLFGSIIGYILGSSRNPPVGGNTPASGDTTTAGNGAATGNPAVTGNPAAANKVQ